MRSGQLHPYPLSPSRCHSAPARAPLSASSLQPAPTGAKEAKPLSKQEHPGELAASVRESDLSLKKGLGGEEATTAP